MNPGRRSQCGGKLCIDPIFDVLHDRFLIEVVEKVVKPSFVELQCFVHGAHHVVKVLAAAGLRVLVESVP